MYNRYIPQSDGSFRRSPMENPAPEPPASAPGPPAQQSAPPAGQKPAPPPAAHHRAQPALPNTAGSPGGFLAGLLPHSFDTEDMIIILLLLLLGNAGKEQNISFLTLIIYLFL